MKKKLTDNDIDYLINNYEFTSINDMEKHLNLKYEDFRKIANKLGLKRSKSSKHHDLKKNIILNKCNELNYKFIEFVDGVYKNAYSQFNIICDNGHTYDTNYNKFINTGSKCKYCLNQYDKTTVYLSEIKNKLHILNYKLLDIPENISLNTKIKIECDQNHRITTTYNYLIGKNSKCYRCRELTIDKAIEKINTVCNIKKYSFLGFTDTFNSNKSYINIKCSKNHTWHTMYRNFVGKLGRGCPYCNASKGELEIQKYLENKQIKYIKEKTFDGCKVKRNLRFDFYIPELNLAIEYDGAHHYIPIDVFGGSDNLKTIQKHDEIKNRYCYDNNIGLLRISYKDDIQLILDNYFNES